MPASLRGSKERRLRQLVLLLWLISPARGWGDVEPQKSKAASQNPPERPNLFTQQNQKITWKKRILAKIKRGENKIRKAEIIITGTTVTAFII